MQCLILAGGLGTRMRPATEKIPKALIPANGVPFIDYQLAWLAAQGVDNVVVATGYLGHMIEAHVGSGARWGLSVGYSWEGDTLRGTGGAIRCAIERGLMADGFFVIYGDSFLPIDFAPVWTASRGGKLPLVVVFRNEEKWDHSNIVFADGRVTLYEKGRTDARAIGMNYIDYGLSVLQRSLLERLVPENEVVDLGSIYRRLSLDGDLAGYEVHQRFYEVGSPSGLRDFEEFAAQKGLRTTAD